MMISNLSFVTPAPENEVVFCDLDGEVALLHLGKGLYFGLNRVGARIWHLLGTGRAVGEVREELLREFEVDAARCEQDLWQLLQQMADAELVGVRDAAKVGLSA